MSYQNTAASHLLISIYQDGVQVQLHVVEYPQKYCRYLKRCINGKLRKRKRVAVRIETAFD